MTLAEEMAHREFVARKEGLQKANKIILAWKASGMSEAEITSILKASGMDEAEIAEITGLSWEVVAMLD